MHDNLVSRKNFIQIVGLTLIAAACVWILWQTETAPRPAESESFNLPQEYVAEKPPTFQLQDFSDKEGPEILATIYDDSYLERKAFYYLVHRMLATDEKDIAASADAAMNWETLVDLAQREKIRGRVMHIRGTLVGLKPFKIGQAGDCYVFCKEDFGDFRKLIQKLRSADMAASAHIYNQFSPDTRKMLDSYNAFLPAPPSEALQQALLYEFNCILQDPALYDKDRFLEVRLRDETRRLSEGSPGQYDLLRANRLLLEDAYPEEIIRTKSAEDRGLAGYPVWMGSVHVEGRPYLVIFSDLPQNLRQLDKVEILGAFYKVWLYQSEAGKQTRSHVFIGKNLRLISHFQPYSSRTLEWCLLAVLGITGIFLAAAILHERRERNRTLQRRRQKMDPDL